MTNEHASAASALDALEAQFARRWALQEAAGILDWDAQTMMPIGAGEARGETSAALAGAAHELLVDPRVAEWLDAAESLPEPDAGDEHAHWRRANLREMRRIWAHASAASTDLVEARERAISSCELTWRTARVESDFSALLPRLTEVLKLTRELAAAKAERLGLSPYDALMDEFEPGARAAHIETVFDELGAFLPGFLDDVLARQPDAPPVFEHAFPEDRQKTLCLEMMRAAGFDFARGRLDVSMHPFCGGATDDVRITTRYDADDPLKGLFGVMHETGHALYEQGLPPHWGKQPVGYSRGMALHESQSLLIEMQVVRGEDFLGFAAPIIAEELGRPADDPEFSLEMLLRRAQRVERGFIRVDADEVSYPLHVILRMRLEKALILGDMELADLPGAWNDGMKDLLGVTPPNDRLGCLQDIHWPSGAWGYFPTYTLGAMAAAQIYEAALAAVPEIPSKLREGDFAPLLGWLRENIHAKASSQSTEEILQSATGKPLGSDAFMRRLKLRYGA